MTLPSVFVSLIFILHIGRNPSLGYAHNYNLQVTHEGKWYFVNITCINEHDVHVQNEPRRNLKRSVTSSKGTNDISSEDSKEDDKELSPSLEDSDSLQPSAEFTHLRNSILRGGSDVHAVVHCEQAVLQDNAVGSEVESLFLSTTGALRVESGWIPTNSSLTSLKLIPEGDLALPDSCDWLPSSVHTLDLSHVSVDLESLSKCSWNVRKLSLAGSSLSHLELCMPSLETLDASWNNLRIVNHPESCENPNGVVELKLSHNKLSSWSSCGFQELSHLVLDNNNLSSIQFSECPCKKLAIVDLHRNHFVDIPNDLPITVVELYMSFNKIEKTIPLESSMKIVDLSHNQIKEIATGTFKWTWELYSLDLSHNSLSKLKGKEFMELRNLRLLDLSHNRLHFIHYETFSFLQQVEELNLIGNKLHQLDVRLLNDLPSKLVFKVEQNPWKCSCHLLASLVNLERKHCKKNCPRESKISCKEQGYLVSARIILRRCLEAVKEISEAGSLREVAASDEDISEEKKDVAMFAGPSGFLIILILVAAAITSKAYMEREKLKKYWRNLIKRNDTTETPSFYSLQRAHVVESDSETEV